MREVRTENMINATPNAVWDVLLDVAKYSEWHPMVKNVEGYLAPGERLKIFVHRETFKGILVWMLWKSLKSKIVPNFELANEALKARVGAASKNTPK